MAIQTLTFDPDGDLHLRLTCPSEISPPKTEGTAKTDPVVHGSDASADGAVLTPPGSDLGSAEAVENPCSDSAEEACKEIDMLVSSKHLMLASPVFKAMLQRGTFLEGKKLQSGGAVVIPLPDDDPDIFQILLNIVHGRVRQVPNQVSVKVMTGLSILVDKYQMHEIVELYVRTWMPELKKSLPAKLDSTLLSWISICYVFRISAEYQHVTRLAKLESCSPLGTDGEHDFPIPSLVINRIESKRQTGVASLLSTITAIINIYNKSKVICGTNFKGNLSIYRYACDSMVVGSLLKSASSHGLWPLPLVPYSGRSIKQTAETIRVLQLVAMCDAPFHSWTQNPPLPAHGMIKRLRDAADCAEKECEGLVFDGTT
ncbi:hypothetical protein IFR05_003994 [Cadophora sp. M221]|nr:hypothetical protein IFR05_003994 [Cadophora sp. M221]